jgi:nucleoside-diphosphate kinase
MERTYAMIKPDAVKAGNIGNIVTLIEQAGFSIIRMELRKLSTEKAEEFYEVHHERPFFGELVEFMISGPVVCMILEKEGAIAAWRELMGATDPAEAAEGTIRKLYARSKGSNATHGSDAPETAATEIGLMFPGLE